MLGALDSNSSSSKKKKVFWGIFFGSPTYELSSSLIENYYSDRLGFILIWPYSDLFRAYLAPIGNM